MTRTIQKENTELYRCEECGFHYADDSTSLTTGKEWAEKCEAWCKQHKSCNIEIISHTVPQENESKKDGLDPVRNSPPTGPSGAQSAGVVSNGVKPEDIKLLTHSINSGLALSDVEGLTKLFYGLIGIASSLAFFLALYWVLRLDSAITNVITNTYDTPFYFWPYVILTFGAIILFGINISLLVYRWRKFGPPRLQTESGGGAGTLFGIAASACPVCGSTLLSAIGIAGGLAAFPLGGLELKALSLGLLALPLWLTRKDLRKLEADCLPAEASAQAGASGVCPLPKDHSFKETDRPWLFVLLAVVIALSFIGWNWLKTEPIIAKALANNSILSPNDNQLASASVSSSGNLLFGEVTANVLPQRGFQSKIFLQDSAATITMMRCFLRQRHDVRVLFLTG